MKQAPLSLKPSGGGFPKRQGCRASGAPTRPLLRNAAFVKQGPPPSLLVATEIPAKTAWVRCIFCWKPSDLPPPHHTPYTQTFPAAPVAHVRHLCRAHALLPELRGDCGLARGLARAEGSWTWINFGPNGSKSKSLDQMANFLMASWKEGSLEKNGNGRYP